MVKKQHTYGGDERPAGVVGAALLAAGVAIARVRAEGGVSSSAAGASGNTSAQNHTCISVMYTSGAGCWAERKKVSERVREHARVRACREREKWEVCERQIVREKENKWTRDDEGEGASKRQ